MIISELTYVNEMTLTIGLALATIGTFLGGIWANESWEDIGDGMQKKHGH